MSLRYIGPYEIVKRIKTAAYKLALPPELARLHNMFHVLMLRKYIKDPSHVIEPQTVDLDENVTYEEQPVRILDREVRQLWNKMILMVKVLWHSQTLEEMTWKTEESMQQQYPELFDNGK